MRIVLVSLVVLLCGCTPEAEWLSKNHQAKRAKVVSIPTSNVFYLPLLEKTVILKTFDGTCWSGRVVGDPESMVTYCQHRGTLVADIFTSTGRYEIRPIGGGLHIIAEIDETKLPK